MTQNKARPAVRRVQELVFPKEPLLIFRGQPIAFLLPVVLGLMALLAAFFMLRTVAEIYELRLARGLARSELTLFIPTTPGLGTADKDPAVNRALNVLQNTSSLGRIEVLDRPDTQLMLEEAMGENVSSGVPLPAVITIRRSRGGDLDIEELRASLDRAAPGALLEDNQALQNQIAAEEGKAVVQGFGIVLLVFAVAGLVSVLSVGQAMDLQEPVLEVLSIAGAPDLVIEQQFRGFALRSALLGVVPGVVLGWGCVVISWPRAFVEASKVIPLQVLIMVGLIVLLAGLTVLVTRWSVLRKLKRRF